MESKISPKKQHRRDESLEVTTLLAKKRGRLLLLGEEMDEQLSQSFLETIKLRENAWEG